MRAGWRGALAASAVVLVARAAGAQVRPESEVDAMVRRGVALRQQGHEEEALGEFRRAQAMSGEPRVLAQVGLAEQALGRWLDADRHLAEAQRAADDPWIRRNRAPLAEARAQVATHLGRVRIFAEAPGAEAFANGELLGALPMPEGAPVVAGTNLLEVRAPGYVTMTRRAEVDAGHEARETFAMVREPAPAVAPAVVAAPGPMMPAASIAAPGPQTPGVRTGGARRAWAWATLALGAAGLGVGTFATARVVGAVSRYDTDPTCPGTSAATQPAACAAHLDDVATMQPLAVAGFVAGGALAITSVVLFATAPSGEEGRRAEAFRCGVGVAGVSCGGVF